MEEKENQLTAVSLEREELKSKLSRLQSLVTTFMKRDSANAATVAAQGAFSLLLTFILSSLFASGFLTARRGFGLSDALWKLFQASPVRKSNSVVW